MEVVKVKDLSKIYTEGYTKVMALRGVNLSVKEKEFIAIIGPSGSGKSTLLNLIGGLDEPYEGRVIVNNKDIYKMSDEELTIFRRREIGYIFQFYNLIPTITVKDNILLPLKLDNREVDSKYLDEIVAFMNIKDSLNFYPSSLSGGQKQRVAIARALITKPSIILADEPTGNLDTKTAKDVINLMKLSVLKYHQTLIMITHNPTIASHADRIIKLVDGRIIGEIKLYLDNKSFNNRKILYSNKVRTKSIIITTMAIIALISLLIFISDGMVLEKIKHVESIYGKYHIEIRDINSKQLEIIKSNNNIDKIGIVNNYSNNTISEKWIVARIGYYDEISRELLNIELIDGDYPREKKEIAFEQWVLEYLDTETQKNIEDYVTLNNASLNENDYLSDLPDYYKIVGVLGNREHKKDTKLTVGLVSEEQTYEIDPLKKTYNVYMKFDDIRRMDNIVNDLIKYNHISEKNNS